MAAVVVDQTGGGGSGVGMEGWDACGTACAVLVEREADRIDGCLEKESEVQGKRVGDQLMGLDLWLDDIPEDGGS